jgi:hypothetical protein
MELEGVTLSDGEVKKRAASFEAGWPFDRLRMMRWRACR